MTNAKIQKLLQDGIEHQKAGRMDEALAAYGEVGRAVPKMFDPWFLSGTAMYYQGRLEDAEALLREARQRDPRSTSGKLFLGMVLADLGKYEESVPLLRSAVQAHPGYPEAWIGLAEGLMEAGRHAEAAACYRRLVALRPESPAAHERLGRALLLSSGLAAAEPSLRRAIELDPDFPLAWTSLGLALIEAPGRLLEAEACLRRGLLAPPIAKRARLGLAAIRVRSYRMREALDEYATVLALEPLDAEALGATALFLNHLPSRDRAEVFALHENFRHAVELPSTVPFPNPRYPNRRLRVGFLSPSLHSGAVAPFLEPLLRHLNAGQFEVYLYHNDTVVDETSDRLQVSASGWKNLVRLDDTAAETLIRRDTLDIIVDLAGHLPGNRLALLARRLAPVQISYLGYPNTTGLTVCDYRLVDELSCPARDACSFHTEKLVRFAPTAWTFGPTDVAPEVGPLPSADGRSITFGSFVDFAKVTDEMLRVWSQVLAAVPGSRLVLKSARLDDAEVLGFVRPRLEAAGLTADQVTLHGRVATTEAHLAYYGQIDAALDTFPYNGTIATCEAMWMGVPVITRAGDRPASRIGLSLVTAAGHPEFVARTDDDYVRLATVLVADRARLAALRASLRQDMLASPLLDHVAQTAHFEAALRRCWGAWCGVTVAETQTALN